jgi:hypothetical protein
VAVFTDFTKAYDTVDREFLFAVASQLGVGAVHVLLWATAMWIDDWLA